MLNENLDIFLGIFAVPVVWKTTTGKGILDAPTNVVGNSLVLTNEYLLTARTDQFGLAAYGDAISVGGVAYTVRESRQVDDGSFTEILLSKV